MKLNEARDDQLTATYIKMRDELASMEAAHKNAVAPLAARMQKIENEALRRLLERGSESVRTDMGTFFKSSRVSVSIADWDAFFNGFVVKNEAWDMIERRPSKNSVVQYKGETGDLPPGINWREEHSVRFHRA